MTTTAGEVQAYIKAGAKLTPKGWEWHKKWSISEKQIACFALIRGLQAQVSFLKSYYDISRLSYGN